jgi:CheY-like chemotaxis protein
MNLPVALLSHEKLLPGSQVGVRLRGLGYRVESPAEARRLVETAEACAPLVVVMDLESTTTDTCALIRDLRRSAAVGHVPVLAFAGPKTDKLRQSAVAAGATLVAEEAAILAQLPALLDQVLRVE